MKNHVESTMEIGHNICSLYSSEEGYSLLIAPQTHDVLMELLSNRAHDLNIIIFWLFFAVRTLTNCMRWTWLLSSDLSLAEGEEVELLLLSQLDWTLAYLYLYLTHAHCIVSWKSKFGQRSCCHNMG